MGMRRPETSRATIVPMPDAIRVTPTSNLVRIATRTVAGNMVKTCWKPSETMAPNGGTSCGRYPTADFTFVSAAIFSLLIDLVSKNKKEHTKLLRPYPHVFRCTSAYPDFDA